jgi:hypothetical protein
VLVGDGLGGFAERMDAADDAGRTPPEKAPRPTLRPPDTDADVVIT